MLSLPRPLFKIQNLSKAIDPENDGYNKLANYCFVSPVLNFTEDKEQIARWLVAFASNNSNRKHADNYTEPVFRAQMVEFPDIAMQMNKIRV